MRIGHGFDVHKFTEGSFIYLGGVQIPHSKGILAHSDGDVLIHAICDAILGACALGDIGRHFPDTDDYYKGISSRKLLVQSLNLARQKGYCLSNLDCTIIAEKPKMSPYIEDMRYNLSCDLSTSKDNINIKATTTEKLGYIGKQEGIASHAVVIMKPSS
jgi:2-C-methyl-D-erythritol 2,4-cyclodiphosphate synthase